MTSKKEPKPALTSAEKFTTDLALTTSAAIGAMIIRTREPYEALEAVQQMCAAEKRPFRMWEVFRGWSKIDILDPTLPITAQDQDTVDILPALHKLHAGVEQDIKGGEEKSNAPAGGVDMPNNAWYAMIWPHPYVKAFPQSHAFIASLSHKMPFTNRRFMLIVPPTFEPPAELADTVPIVDYLLPAQPELTSIYREVIEDAPEPMAPIIKSLTDDDEAPIVAAGAGMSRKEFTAGVCYALVQMKREGERGGEALRRIVLKRKTEVVKRSEVLSVMSEESMSNVGGLEALKEWVRERASCFSEAAVKAGVDRPKGCALVGPPGTGKSLGAKAIAKELGLPAIGFDVSRVFGSLVGESEGRMAAALQMLDAMAPCVVLIDEIDKVFSTGTGNDSGVGARVLGKVLTHMQESKAPIFWVVTANRVDNLPPELLRKGRLDEVWSVTTPNENERLEILNIHLRKRGHDPAKIEGLALVAAETGQFVGAELEGIIKEAAVTAYSAKKPIDVEMLNRARKSTKTLATAFAAQFEHMRTWCESHARPSSLEGPPRTPGGEPQRRRRSVGADTMAG